MFLYKQFNSHTTQASNVPLLTSFLSHFYPCVSVFHSAAATFFAPSDPSGTGGMQREYIHSTPSWRNGPAHYDTVFIKTDLKLPGMSGMHVARCSDWSGLASDWSRPKPSWAKVQWPMMALAQA